MLDGGIESILGLNVNDGLPSEEINELAWFEDQLWVATSKGVAVIQPEGLRANMWCRPKYYLQAS
jgi:ligand-binding sensor domain-containing protein